MTDSHIPDCNNNLATIPNTISVSMSNSRDMFDLSGYGDCLCLLAPTSSRAYSNFPKIVTTDYMGDTGYSYFDENVGANRDGDCSFINLNYTTCFGGTSASTPLVAGTAGLILSANPALTRDDVKYLLQDCADKIENSQAHYSPTNGKSTAGTHGYGRLNAFEAVKIASAHTDLGGRDGVDIFVRDNFLDWGNTEKPSNYLFEPIRGFIPHWNSPDIKVDAPDASNNYETPTTSRDFENFTDQNPLANKTNKVYVRVRNRGYRPADNVLVKLYWVYAGAQLPLLWSDFPADVSSNPDWHFLGTQSIPKLTYSGSSLAGTDLDAAQIVSFSFIAPTPDPTLPNHYCLLAMISCDADPLVSNGEKNLDLVTPYFNNITHRNYSIETSSESGSYQESLYIYNPYAYPVENKITFINPGKTSLRITKGPPIDTTYILNPFEKRLLSFNVNNVDLKSPVTITVQQEIYLGAKKKKKVIGGFTYYFKK
jgi:hypothetical protein